MKIEQKHFDALLKGQRCKFWDDKREGVVKKLSGIQNDIEPFIDEDEVWWQYCEPLKTVRYLKEPVELMKALIEGGWKPKDIYFEKEGTTLLFNNKMWIDCGKSEHEWSKDWVVDPSWIEEREE